MDLHVKLGLFLALCSAASTVDVQNYVPQLTSLKNVTYNVTSNGFVLDQPKCVFNQYPTTNVWLVVANSDAVSRINASTLDNPVPYSLFKNNQSDYYHTLPMPAKMYPCSNGTIDVLLVGLENCTGKTFCNGPLNNTFKYRAKFVLLTNTETFNQTKWSDEIVLPKQNKFVGETGPKGRSGGMIALTTILSVLLAIMLISLLIALPIGSRDICWKRTLNYDSEHYAVVDYLTRVSYITHYINFNSSFRDRKPLSEDM